MARGLAQPVGLRGSGASAPSREGEGLPSGPPPNKVVGVVCSGNLATHRDQVKSALERGKEQRPEAVWVCLEPKSDRLTHDVMLSLDIEPVVLPLVADWKGAEYDLRRTWRDGELLHLCDELIVFHKRTGNSPWRERAASGLYEGRLFVVELGEAKAKKKNGKRPSYV